MSLIKFNDDGSELSALSYVRRKVLEQRFYEIPFARFVPVIISENSLPDELVVVKNVGPANNFEEAVTSAGANNLYEAQLATGKEVAKVFLWAAKSRYTLFEMERMLKHHSYDIVEARYKARKKMWDLGLQKVAFTGLTNHEGAGGLVNNKKVAAKAKALQQGLAQMSLSELSHFCYEALTGYREQTEDGTWPNTFLLPMSDWVALAMPSETNKVPNKLELMKKAFSHITRNSQFIIEPLPYLDDIKTAAGKINRYVLYANHEDVLQLNITHDFTTTTPTSLNNFEYEDVAYGAFTGVIISRPQELLYFDKEI
ncbi:MAG: DUF2184 domain-containing protein [Spirochaetaceae bacterium]|nr:DUF2184 domain-containing protein [Spirochaetaceae bacterium]